MKIGILEAGAPPGALLQRFGGYADMVRRLLPQSMQTRVYDVRVGDLPEPGDDCEGLVITGSASGAYDPDGWIAALQTFLEDRDGSAPLVGICFGHQLMAQAYGGHVVRSPKGRAAGLHRYDIWRRAAFMDGADPIRLPVSHQDQVVAVGADCVVLGGCDFTPYGLLAYPERRAVSIQAHPEFEPDFARALVEAEREALGDERADAAIASLSGPNDRLSVAGWLARFLETGAV